MTAGDPSYWDDFFKDNLLPAVLAHVLATWRQMVKPGPSDLEDAISLKLYSALVNGKDRNSHAFLIRYQDMEVNTDLAKVMGIKDIVFFPSLQDEEVYLCLEAKRLNAVISGTRRSLADEYVKEGMQRFVDGKYSRKVRHGGMLGYVLDGDISLAMTNVLTNIKSHHKPLQMKPPGDWQNSTVLPKEPCAKESMHAGKEKDTTFRIHHLFINGVGAGATANSPPPAPSSKPAT